MKTYPSILMFLNPRPFNKVLRPLLLTIALLVGMEARAIDLSIQRIRAIAENTPLVERPQKAAELISHAVSQEQTRVAIRVVRLFLVEAHSLAPSLVASIVKQHPTIAKAVVLETISLFPELAYSITQAAISNAPDQAAQIALQAAIQHVDQAEPILAASLATQPNVEPYLIAFLEDPATMQRTHSESSLVSFSRYFSRYNKYKKNRKKTPPPPKTRDRDDDDDDRRRPRHPKIPSIDPEDLPFSEHIEISQLRRGKWLIEIEVPKGRIGNQILKQIRSALKRILKNPHLRHHFRIKIERYTR